MPAVRLTEEAVKILQDFRWPGNIRQLKNVTEQISVIEQERMVDGTTLRKYIPEHDPMLPTLTTGHDKGEASFASEREILYKILFDMKKDMNDLKRLVYDLMQNEPQRETGTTDNLPLPPVQPFSTTGKIIFRIPKQSSRSPFPSKKKKKN